MLEKKKLEPEKIIKRIAGYARVSTIEQGENFSTKGQIDHIHAYVQMKEQAQLISMNYQTGPIEMWGSNQVRIFQDKESGASSTRAGLLELTHAVVNGEIDILIVWKIDRLYRNVKAMLEFVAILDAHGVVLISLCEPVDGTPAGKFFLTLMGAFAEMERNNIRDRGINGKNTKAKAGYFVGGNYSPYGYNFEHDGTGNKIIINKEQAVIVREIFDLYTNQNISSSDIAKRLNERGVATKFNYEGKKAIDKDGGNLKALKKAQKNFWHRSSIDKILRNELYAGRYYYGKLRSENLITSYVDGKIKRKIRRVPNPKQAHVPFDCPAIIDRELYERTIYELKKRQKITTKTPHLFTGLIECGLCGKRYGGYINRQGNVCYRCNGKNKHKVPLNEICQFSSEVSEKWLFSKVWKVADLILLEPDKFLADYFKKRPTKNKNSMTDVEARIKADNNTLIKLREDLDMYIDARTLADRGTDPSYSKHIDHYKKRVDETDEKIANLIESIEASKNQYKNLLNISKQYETLQILSNLYKEKYKLLKPEEKSYIATKLVKSIKLFPDKAILEICIYHQTVGDTEPSDEDRCPPALQKQLLRQDATKLV